MKFSRPKLNDLKEIVNGFNMKLDNKEIEDFFEVMQDTIDNYETVSNLDDFIPNKENVERNYKYPTETENKLNAWFIKTNIKKNNYGILNNKKVVIKDNVCIADIPMINGSSTLKGYVPDFDATIVTRLLEAGAEIKSL